MVKIFEILHRLEGMSKNIVDDARFEKVLSFLESELKSERKIDQFLKEIETLQVGHFLEIFKVF